MGTTRMMVEDVIRIEVGHTNFGPATAIRDLVADSLEYVSLISALENELGIKLGNVHHIETVGELTDAINISARVV